MTARGASETSTTPRGVRLQRVLADAGVAARRACEELIEQGHVRVNGQTVRRLPIFVDPASDRIEVDGRLVKPPSRRLYVMLHKPERTLVTAADEPGMGRATVMNLVDHPAADRLFPVGRLDFDSTGLVLLTNDGELANRLTHPRYGVTKTYQVVVKGGLDPQAAEAIRTKSRLASQREDQERGRVVRGSGAPEIRVVGREPGKTLLEVTLREARNRQLRDVLKHLGMPVKKLTRIGIGPLQLKGLAIGRWRELTRDELQALRAAAFPGSGGGRSPKKGKAGAHSRRPRRSEP